jgi:hypothetical protein
MPRAASEMRDDLHGAAPRAAPTVPVVDADETTKVSLPAGRAGATARSVGRNRQRVVVPVPEETWVSQKQGRAGRKWLVGAVLIAGLVAITAVLYSLLSGDDTRRLKQATQPVVRSTPGPTPSPTPVENANRQANVNSQPVVGPAELDAREKLAQKNITYSEEAFTRAVEDGDTGAVDLFLAAGMSPEAQDATGRTALINAASRGSDNISRKLLSRRADVNARDGAGSTALMEAALNDHKDTVRVLLEAGADVNLTDNNGQTALLRAAARGHSRIVRMLLNKGARIDLKDKDGRDALTWAEINNKSDVTDLLKKAGAARR